MYVCICQAVTDKDIRQAAREGVRTLEDLGDTLGVGTCCGTCGPEACSLLAEEHGDAVGSAAGDELVAA
jgi:bacterioferritin-associated ferredoxin